MPATTLLRSFTGPRARGPGRRPATGAANATGRRSLWPRTSFAALPPSLLMLALVAVGAAGAVGGVGCASTQPPTEARGARPAAPAVASGASAATPDAGGGARDAGDALATWRRELLGAESCAAAFARLFALDPAALRPLVPLLSELSRTDPQRSEACASGGQRRAEYLQVIARLRDPATIPLFVEALDFDEDAFEHAVVAAGFLRDVKAVEAVEPLLRAMLQRLPIKSRANNARLAALSALSAIGDARAVPGLSELLLRPADEQDFLLNQRAALALGRFADARAVPALVDGMFMWGRGAQIVDECRLALVSIGAPAVPAVLPLLDPASPEAVALAGRQHLEGRELARLPERAAIVLSDLKVTRAVPALLAALRRRPAPAAAQAQPGPEWLARQQPVNERATILLALGLIGDGAASAGLLSVLKDRKASAEHRTAAAEALAWSGDARAVPALLAVARSSPAPAEGQRDLRVYAMTAAVHLSTLGRSREVRTALDRLVARYPTITGLRQAQDGLTVVETCAGDLGCLATALRDPPSGLTEAAAFALVHAQDRRTALALLVDALVPLAEVPPALYARRLVMLVATRRLSDAATAEIRAKLDALIERDALATRLPGARRLLGEERVAAALLQRKE